MTLGYLCIIQMISIEVEKVWWTRHCTRDCDEPDTVLGARHAKLNEKQSPVRSERQTCRKIFTLQCDKCSWKRTLFIEWVGIRKEKKEPLGWWRWLHTRGCFTLSQKITWSCWRRKTVKGLPGRGITNKGSEAWKRWHIL